MDLILVTGRFPQRSETFIYRKAVGLAKQGHRVTVLVRELGDWSLYPDPLPPSLHVEVMPPDEVRRHPSRALRLVAGVTAATLRQPARARELVSLSREGDHTASASWRTFARHAAFLGRRADVMHFEFLSLAAMYPLARELTEIPTVVSCRGNDVHTLELKPAAERGNAIAVLQCADAIHCVSDEMKSHVERLTGRTEGIWVNRPAVETDRISQRIAPGRDTVHLLATGRLVWKKGFDYLLNALAIMKRSGVPFKATILGDGELRNFLRFSITDLGLEDEVELAGGVASSEVLRRMQDTDIFVLSSHEEGISNAVLEAMASGIPIVTTEAGGMAEAVRDGIDGYVVRVRDAELLADRIMRLAGDPQRRRAMGAAARERALDAFSITRQIRVFETLYKSIARREQS